MKNMALIILCLLVIATGFDGASAKDKAPDGITYTFLGGNWVDTDSWSPELSAAGGPGEDDNIIIPAGKSVTMPDFCSIATLTIEGNITMGGELRVNSMIISPGGVFNADGEIRCTGKFINKSGKLKSNKSLKIIVQTIDNSGQIECGGYLNIMSIGKFYNHHNITVNGTLMIRCHELFNVGNIKSNTGTIAIFSNTEINNSGNIIAGSDGNSSDGGNVFIACQIFRGTGQVTAGNGKDGNPPGKAGKTIIGKTFDNTSWTNENPTAPTGIISDLTAWNTQISKNPAKDGTLIIPREKLLTLDTPTNVKKMYDGNGYSFICGVGGGTINTTLNWNGTDSVKVYGKTNHGSLSSPVEYLSAGDKVKVSLDIPVSRSGKRELKRVSVRYHIPETSFATRLTVYVYYLPCPIIKGSVGETSCTVEDDNGIIESDKMPVKPTIVNDRLMVPLRFVVEACDGEVSWDETTRTATIQLPGRTATFTPNSAETKVNGFLEGLFTTSTITSDCMMVSARSLAEVMGADIEFENGSFVFTYPGK